MSQWNNSYNYNNQYQQGPNGWNGDLNSQYMNQAYYSRPDANGQYVSFNEFLTQMQTSNVAPTVNPNTFSNVPYENYTPNQFNFQNMPSSSQTQHNSYNYGPNEANTSYPVNPQSQLSTQPPEPKTYTNNMAFKSNLTATAVEFVPKGSALKPSTSSQNIPESSKEVNDSINEDKSNYGNSSDRNWRQRPPSSQKTSHVKDKPVPNGHPPDNHKSKGRNRDSAQRNNESNGGQDNRTHDLTADREPSTSNSRNQEPNNRSRDTSQQNETSSLNREPRQRNYDSNNRNQESRSNNRNQESHQKNERNQETRERNSRQNYDSNERGQELKDYDSNQRSDPSRNDRRNYAKGNSKSKGKDDNRTFYNSAINKDSQDVRSGRGEGKGENSGRTDGSTRGEGYGRTEGTSRGEGYGRTEVSSRGEGYGRTEGSTRGEGYGRTEGSTRGESYGRTEGSSRGEGYGRTESSSRGEGYGRTEGSSRGDGYGRAEGASRGDGYGRTEGSSRGEGYGRAEGASRGDGYGRAEGSSRPEGSGRSQRNWAGTQRVRGDRNQDDEQYANNYQQKEERGERDRYDRGGDRGYDRGERGYDRQDRERAPKSNLSSPARFKSKYQADLANNEMTQRERLTDQLDKGTLECLVCCDRVRQTDPVWSCSNCYHVLHLRCIRKWAMSSIIEGKWRCPACQNTSKTIPTEYRCMCGAIRSPDYQRGGSSAHTCGKACKRERTCPHPCTLLCHPGPCPPCQATVSKQCGCGAETRSVTCSNKLPQTCARTCGRALACRVHACTAVCHEGDCAECDKTVTQVCYCPAATERSVPCTRETGAMQHWACERACGRILACGAHVCRAPCHAPACAACALLPAAVLTCPCGKMQLDKDARKACTDPIPLCGNICAKPLPCGPAGDRHFCKLVCHEGSCPVCPDSTLVQCRCGHSSREVTCAELPEMLNNVLCQKKCNKKLSCGRHRCRTACCAASAHRCTVSCARSLTCGLHRCEEFCHTGHCPPCPRVSFDELRCECGAAVLLPPVHCGQRAPACEGPCLRARPCLHPPHHSCHTGECPPCVVLTTKRCYGGHEERKTIPCSLEEFSCGLPCGKPLPCGKHTCIKICHKGSCDAGKCTQPCTEKRPACGHVCNAACHSSALAESVAAVCPSAAPCRQLVRATCPCGRRRAERCCSENARDYTKMMSALAATKMQEGGAFEISEQRPGNMLKTLECDDECRVEARTRQMALALQIRNPDVSAKLAPRYSEHVRTTATREPTFAQQTHDKLTELVQLAKKSKQKTRAHSFPSMNWQKRQFIHELCEHFGCESVAYDAEPNRNVVATADKEKSWLPAMSVLEVLGREAGKRRVPGPVLRAPPAAAGVSPAANKSTSGWATLTSSKSTNAWGARSQAPPAPGPRTAPAPAPSHKIDYFDNPPDN